MDAANANAYAASGFLNAMDVYSAAEYSKIIAGPHYKYLYRDILSRAFTYP
jgi:hypothetical protein